MSFIDAARLADVGAGQIFAGHSAPGQTVNDGIVMLTAGDRPAPAIPQAKIVAPHAFLAPPGKSRYELLRAIHRAQPKCEIGREADKVLREGKLLSRFRFGKTVMRRQNKAVDAIIASAIRQPRLRALLTPKPRPGQSGFAAHYEVLKQMTDCAPESAAKTISLRQLPHLLPRPGFGKRRLLDCALA